MGIFFENYRAKGKLYKQNLGMVVQDTKFKHFYFKVVNFFQDCYGTKNTAISIKNPILYFKAT